MAHDDDALRTPSGEAPRRNETFTADHIATAFEVDPDRVRRAMRGEFGIEANASADTRQAQHLAEVILGDQPLEQREAALMRLGAYTPRADMVDASVDEKPEGEQSDRIRPSEEAPELGAPRDDG